MLISSKDNPKIKQYIKLASNKKYRNEMGLFVIEGARVCRDAFEQWANGNLSISACYATQKALEKYSDYIKSEWFNIYDHFNTVSEDVSHKMSDAQFPQGIFVEARIKDNKLNSDKINSKGKYLILDNIQDPGNVGTLLRTAEAVGIDAVIMCNCCDIYNPKVIRSAMGTIFRLEVLQADSFETAVSILKKEKISIFATVVDSNAENIINVDFNGGCAVVMGNEGNGLSKEDVELCDRQITIMMRGNTNSLNVASAGSIFLWEMCRGDQVE